MPEADAVTAASVKAPRLPLFLRFAAAEECSAELLRDSLRVEHLALYWRAGGG